MKYRGYTARFEHDADDDVLVGRVDGIRDVVSFVAPMLPELEREFHISVDVYLSHCAPMGLTPEIPSAEPRRAAS